MYIQTYRFPPYQHTAGFYHDPPFGPLHSAEGKNNEKICFYLVGTSKFLCSSLHYQYCFVFSPLSQCEKIQLGQMRIWPRSGLSCPYLGALQQGPSK
jgi:hypothetical protein